MSSQADDDWLKPVPQYLIIGGIDARDIVRMISSERLYPIRRPLAATLAGAAVAILGGLIGLRAGCRF